VFVGQSVKEGELIGYSDSKGNSTGGHDHSELRINGICIDPNKFDYSFKGTAGKPQTIFLYTNPVEVTVNVVEGVNVRNSPNRTSSKIKILKKGSKFISTGYIEGELVNSNNLWWKTSDNLFVWSGGTDLVPTAVKEGGKKMNLTEYEAKKAELESKKSSIEAKQAEVESRKSAIAEEEKVIAEDSASFQKEWEAFATETVEEPKVEEEPVVEVKPEESMAPVEVVVEPVAEEVKVGYEIKEEWPIEITVAVKQINELLSSVKEYVK
jgi:hypothetical protein